ncbi:MAG: serine/threonine protein kinase [Lachnospiraceae bacterium]|nr:serine/threonine protein kinase [Lachnospiraceae bacterium]
MRLSDELALSYYKPVAYIDETHSVQLVQHIETKKFFVMKHLTVYHLDVYQSLLSEPVHNTPRIYLLAEDDKGLTVVEEYIQGDTLQEIIDRNGPLPEAQVLDYAVQLLKIVAELHHRSPAIIHRDIKPANVIISPDGVLKLLDMNAAKYATPEQSRDTMLLGTAGYAAPEQYGFGPSSVQSDLYEIGVWMNVLLTGGLPSEQTPKGKLAPVIRRCTELDPANRYGNVDELMTEVVRIRDGNTASDQTSETQTWRRFLPPGFRSGSVTNAVIALLGYAFLIFIGTGIEIENATPSILLLNRITVILMGVCVILFSANYCNVQEHLPLTRSSHPTLRIIGIVLYDIAIAFFFIILLSVVEPLFA